MGSLMAGWDAPFKDPKTVKYQRNKSLTREEIDAFWLSVKQNGTENQENINHQGGRYQRSCSMPLTDRRESASNFDCSTQHQNYSHQDHFNLEKCWWTRSSSAFLNETPVESMDSPTYKYASQYHLSTSSSPFSHELQSSST